MLDHTWFLTLQVTVGRNLTFALGTLKYETPFGLPIQYMIIIGVAGGEWCGCVCVIGGGGAGGWDRGYLSRGEQSVCAFAPAFVRECL